MITEQDVILVAEKISGTTGLRSDTAFIEIGMDSTQVLEMLIELEIMFDIDLLDESLILDEFEQIQDLHLHLKRLVG